MSFDDASTRGLSYLLEQSVNHVVPFALAGGAGIVFAATPSAVEKNFDFLVVCDSLTKEWIGRCSLAVDIEKLRAKIPGFRPMTKEQLLSALCELVNQVLGVLNGNLEQVGLRPRILLPTFIDLSSGGVTQKAPVYTSYVYASDKEQIFSLTFGLTIIGHDGEMDFTGIKFKPPSGEVEFL